MAGADLGVTNTNVASIRCRLTRSGFKFAREMTDYHQACKGPKGSEDVAMTDEDVRTNAGVQLDSSSAMVRAESEYLDATLHALVARLSSVPGLKIAVSPGLKTAVSRRHGRLRRLIGDLPYINDLHRRTDPVHKIVVEVGPCTHWLHSDYGSIKCGRELTSIERGQVKEELSFTVWATELFDEIARQNLVNHESIVALRHLVEQDGAQ